MSRSISKTQPEDHSSRIGGNTNGHRRRPLRTTGLVLAAVALCWGIGYWWLRKEPSGENPTGNVAAEETVAKLVESEEWILKRTQDLPKLSRSVLNMQLPDFDGAELFDEHVTVFGLQPGAKPTREYELADLKVVGDRWPLANTSRSGSVAKMGLWKPLFDELSYFERAKFYFVRAHFADASRTEIEADMNFVGLARTANGSLVEVNGKQKLGWKKRKEADDESWRIVSWKQKSLTATRSRRPLFRDVLDQVIPDDQQRHRARESIHERKLVELAKDKQATPPHKYFNPRAEDRHPSVSIVDIDRDGFDDLYVMARWGRNMLFRNQGDGTFAEIASELGLDIKDHCSSAIFADFDNDGDVDLFLGRTLKRSMYLVNENGRFVDRTASHVSTLLPYLVFSVSAADYNGDGLMDVFFATYSARTSEKPGWELDFLTEKQRQKMEPIFKGRNQARNLLLDGLAVPNVLLVNRGGGKFELAPENDQLAVWRSTTQGTWADYDGDGDPDLYLSNDYAINTMFRNDGPDGFVDVTDETGTADIGFGMGVSWGDYDLDGRQDLYVTNMFSKAGQRITSQLKSLDPEFAKASRGNSLFRNLGGEFKKVSGLAPPALLVEKAGWSWGGQFVDVNNDGYLDIHALSGFYTPPKGLALPVDL